MTQPHYIDRTLADRLDKAADAQPLLLTKPPQETAVAKLLREAAKAIRASEAPTEADTSLQKMQTTPPDMEAVAWRVKDYADGWILFHNEAPARKSGEARNGALVQALAVIPTEWGGQSSGNTGELNTERKTNDRP